MIVIHEYNPNWPGEFELIRSNIYAVLGDLVLRIDHIGSTSVPGMGSKNVINIQITVSEL